MIQLKPNKNDSMFHTWLKTLFGGDTSTVMIKGSPKTGKTDTALYLSQMLMKYRIIKKVASNIYVDNAKKKNIDYRYIMDMEKLHKWIHQDKISKLYIFDEAITATPSRRPMNKVNVAWMREIPQLSKGRCKLIVITQSEKFSDSIFNNTVFLRATITKVSRKRAIVSCPLIGEFESPWGWIPKTSLSFDPYEVQMFNLNSSKEQREKMNDEEKLFFDWVQDDKSSFLGLSKKLAKDGKHIHATQIMRIIKTYGKYLISSVNIDQKARV